MTTPERFLIAIDYDGTLAENPQHNISDINVFVNPPLPGAREWVLSLLDAGIDIVVFSARELTDAGKKNFLRWLKQWDFPLLPITNVKPYKAKLFIDDRAYHFDGNNYPSPEEVLAFKPWNRPS